MFLLLCNCFLSWTVLRRSVSRVVQTISWPQTSSFLKENKLRLRWFVTVVFTVNLISNNLAVATTDLDDGNLNQTKWAEIEGPEKLELLEMIVEKTKSNYEKIHTWEGEYTVKLVQKVSQEQVADLFNKPVDIPADASLKQKYTFDVTFALDIGHDSYYSDYKSRHTVFMDGASGKTFAYPDDNVKEVKSIITPEHYLHFRPFVEWPGFGFLPNHPQAQNKRAVFREPLENASKQSLGDLLDPRDFFGLSPLQKYWDELNMYAQALSGKAGDEMKQKAKELLHAAKTELGNDTLYRVSITLMGADGNKTHSIMEFSSIGGFNPVRHRLSKSNNGSQPLNSTTWNWKRFEDILLPERVVQTHYSREDGSRIYHREVQLTKVSLNQVLPPDTFTYLGLGLNNGELIVDNINQVVELMKDGKPVELAAFDAEYIPQKEISYRKALFLAANIIILFVVFIIIWQKRLSRKKA